MKSVTIRAAMDCQAWNLDGSLAFTIDKGDTFVSSRAVKFPESNIPYLVVEKEGKSYAVFPSKFVLVSKKVNRM